VGVAVDVGWEDIAGRGFESVPKRDRSLAHVNDAATLDTYIEVGDFASIDVDDVPVYEEVNGRQT
jgi:hypothetical protein